MEGPVILRKLEDSTLKRDRELARLRELAEGLLNRRVSYDVVKDYIAKVSRTRSGLKRSIESCSSPGMGKEFVEPIQTLITFALMVSIGDEEEVLNDIKDYLLREGMSEEVAFIDGELTKLRELSAVASKALKSLSQEPGT
ncbi:MAG: hypothetical protein QW116_06810 [Zestosphaera sp.]